jgi:hypothetical protein
MYTRSIHRDVLYKHNTVYDDVAEEKARKLAKPKRKNDKGAAKATQKKHTGNRQKGNETATAEMEE